MGRASNFLTNGALYTLYKRRNRYYYSNYEALTMANLHKFLCSTTQGQLVISDSYPATDQNRCYDIPYKHSHTPSLVAFTIEMQIITSTNDFENTVVSEEKSPTTNIPNSSQTNKVYDRDRAWVVSSQTEVYRNLIRLILYCTAVHYNMNKNFTIKLEMHFI